MVQESTNSGFTLPDPDDVAGEEVFIGQAAQQERDIQPVADTHVRDMALAIGILLVLMVVFFFIKDAFSRFLVRSKRFSPTHADGAAWWLFGFLTVTVVTVFIIVLYPNMFAWPVLVILPLLTLVMTVRSSRSPHRR